jgi:hypothetical protein
MQQRCSKFACGRNHSKTGCDTANPAPSLAPQAFRHALATIGTLVANADGNDAKPSHPIHRMHPIHHFTKVPHP